MTVVTEKFFTREEVAANNGKDGKPVWLIYKDSVIDVSGYLEKHPGEAAVIMEYAGRDCTKEFNNVGHSNDAKSHMQNLKIGELAESDRAQGKISAVQSMISMSSEEGEKRRKRRFLLCR